MKPLRSATAAISIAAEYISDNVSGSLPGSTKLKRMIEIGMR